MPGNFAHVIGVGLEGEAQDGERPACDRAAARGDDLVGHATLAGLVSCLWRGALRGDGHALRL